MATISKPKCTKNGTLGVLVLRVALSINKERIILTQASTEINYHVLENKILNDYV